jgi:hypothetical protein
MCIAALCLCIPTVASAQVDTTGGEENPDAPKAVGTKAAKEAADAAAKKKHDEYPIELIFRPLTLPAAMSQVSFEYPVNIDPFSASGVLRAEYGVTDKIQVGLRYGIGSLTEDGFTEGKAVAVDGRYLLHDIVALQVSLPVLLDPVATGIVIGAPFRWQFGKFALFGGHDFLSIKFKRFVPSVDDALADSALVAADSTGTTLPDGAIKVLLGMHYQHSERLVITGDIGYVAQDFSSTDAGVPLRVSLMHSFSRKLDLGGRIGFGNLDDAQGTFGISAFVALRI